MSIEIFVSAFYSLHFAFCIIAIRRSYYAPYILLQNAHRLDFHLLFRSEGVEPHGIFILMH